MRGVFSMGLLTAIEPGFELGQEVGAQLGIAHYEPTLDNPAVASADQLRAVWGPFFGEAGTFDVSGDNLVTMQATVAKNPAAMANGAASVYTYEVKADTLTLTQVRMPSGASAAPVRVTLTRVE